MNSVALPAEHQCELVSKCAHWGKLHSNPKRTIITLSSLLGAMGVKGQLNVTTKEDGQVLTDLDSGVKFRFQI